MHKPFFIETPEPVSFLTCNDLTLNSGELGVDIVHVLQAGVDGRQQPHRTAAFKS